MCGIAVYVNCIIVEEKVGLECFEARPAAHSYVNGGRLE